MRGTLPLAMGIALLAISLPALAQAQAQGAAGPGPDWQTVATTVCGALFLGVGAYLRGQGQRIGDMENKHQAFRDVVLREFVPKADADKAIAASNAVVQAQLVALTREIAGLSAQIQALQQKGDAA